MDARALGQRAQTLATAVPFFTRVVSLAALVPSLLVAVAGLSSTARARLLSRVCVSAPAALARLQLWRLATYPFFHSGLFQALLNLVAFVPLCGALERREGTVRAAAALGVLHAAQTALYLAASAVLSTLGFARLGKNPLALCPSGLGGSVFALLALEVHFASERGRVRPLA